MTNNENPDVHVVTDLPKTPKLKFTTRTKVFAGVAVAAITAGTLAIVKARKENDSLESTETETTWLEETVEV